MENSKELVEYDGLKFAPAVVYFPKFDEYKKQAIDIAERIRSIKVTEDNIKEVKVDLAAARKLVNALDTRRKEIKTILFAQFDSFTDQVKELTNLIDQADIVIRDQVRGLEEAERERKKQQIREIWSKRIGNYSISIMNTAFDFWWNPRYANKTMTIRAVEDEMVEWLETTESDIQMLSGMDDEYTIEYFVCLDLNQAIGNVNRRRELGDTVGKTRETEAVAFVVSPDDREKVEQILNSNSIHYFIRRF